MCLNEIPIYAIDRTYAAQEYGFTKSGSYLIGTNDNYAYNGYWKTNKEPHLE